jgi:hypothetical protein
MVFSRALSCLFSSARSGCERKNHDYHGDIAKTFALICEIPAFYKSAKTNVMTMDKQETNNLPKKQVG